MEENLSHAREHPPHHEFRPFFYLGLTPWNQLSFASSDRDGRRSESQVKSAASGERQTRKSVKVGFPSELGVNWVKARFVGHGLDYDSGRTVKGLYAMKGKELKMVRRDESPLSFSLSLFLSLKVPLSWQSSKRTWLMTIIAESWKKILGPNFKIRVEWQGDWVDLTVLGLQSFPPHRRPPQPQTWQ